MDEEARRAVRSLQAQGTHELVEVGKFWLIAPLGRDGWERITFEVENGWRWRSETWAAKRISTLAEFFAELPEFHGNPLKYVDLYISDGKKVLALGQIIGRLL